MSQQQVSRINDVLFYIHQDIGRELSAKELADVAAYSEQHSTSTVFLKTLLGSQFTNTFVAPEWNTPQTS
jgi:hypothetical protein